MSTKNPFAVKLTGDLRTQLTSRLVEEIRTAKQARNTVIDDNGLIDYAYYLYEQAPMKGISRDTHRYGGADLTSPIGTENVDVLSARATRAIFRQEPLWLVEGIGDDSAQKEPIVEAFMQFRQEAIRLQKTCKRAITAAYVETGSILEVCEDAERCVKVEVIKADLARNPDDGTVLLNGKTGQPIPATDPQTGELITVQDDAGEFIEVRRRYVDYRRRGGYVRRRSMKDFLFLPGHAEDDREIYGHANRFWSTLGEIQRKADDGEYNQDAVDLLGHDGHERYQKAENDRSGVQVAYTPGYDTAEKELWRVQVWLDLEGKGLTFYTAVVSEIHGCILSLDYDWLQRFRTVYINPYPCPYSVYGYSVILTKLLTTIEEHTAWRNMNADRATLKANTPMMRLHGAQYDPTIQPFEAGIFIDVASMNELKPMEFEDVTQQAMTKEQQCTTDAQRIIGVNDIALAQTNAQNRTLGENQMATQASFTRTDDPISNIEEALEEVGEILHAIEVQALKEMDQGMPAPASVTKSLQYKDSSFNGVFTSDMIAGQFRFKPRGSTDNADPQKRQQMFLQGIGVMSNWAKLNPDIARRMASPEFGAALVQEIVNELKPRDKAAFLKPLPPDPALMQPGSPAAGPGAPAGQPGGQPGAPPFGQSLLQGLLAHAPQGGTVQ